MNKHRVFCAVRAALAAAFAVCAGGLVMAQTGNSPEPERPPVLYVAGYEWNNDYSPVAMVWKIDGSTVTPIALTDGTRNAGVADITTDGDSLYAAGFEGSGDNFAAMVWKIDGSTVTPIPLTGGKRPGSAGAVIIHQE